MAEEFRPGVRRAGWWNAAEGGADGEPRSGTAPSGSCLAAGDLRSYRWPAEAAVSKPIWSWEESADSETFQGPDPTGASGFLNDLTVPTSNPPLLLHGLEPSLDVSSIFFPEIKSGSRLEENLQAMHQDHLSSRTYLSQESSMGSNGFQTGTGTSGIQSKPFDHQGFLLHGLLNDDFPYPTSNRFAAEGFSRQFSTRDAVKAKGFAKSFRWFQGSAMKKTDGGAPALKKPRVETPSPLPSFKVRKEKLGDRITALQQLVSPFGKTDTASVLYEAIEYIKLLHEQVGVLTTPYLKTGPSMQHKRADSDNSSKSDDPKDDLRSRGLCLVPISSTFPVINETTPDFWTPTFGAPYRLER
ncbi:unnamed protein product [Spirodela intermedia]|uniref:BHLH domain-containing protein n=1 Tax=Spirodela intermedia TaxID=51605 RepID=A0A7I8IFD0_SPIIN|nr:unnamed protein product [Spirodela intermedia]CAA6656510.1 unnamed protein product [Spirodela intermedia]